MQWEDLFILIITFDNIRGIAYAVSSGIVLILSDFYEAHAQRSETTETAII